MKIILAQLVEHCTGIVEIMGSNTVYILARLVDHCTGIVDIMGSNPVYILARLVEHCTGIAKFIDSNPNFSGFIFTTGQVVLTAAKFSFILIS